MANPDQKTILIEETSTEIIQICKKFQADSGWSDPEVKTILRKIARIWEIEEKKFFRVKLIYMSCHLNSSKHHYSWSHCN